MVAEKSSCESFLQLVEQRKSCRDYLDKEIPAKVLQNCLRASQLAPSACNKQPWRFVIVSDKKLREKISTSGLLPGIAMPWLAQAPIIAILCAKKSTMTHDIAPLLSGVKYHLIDIGIAGEHFVLAAKSHGLGSCWIGWFKERYIKKLLNIPKNVIILSLISLGYPASESKPTTRLPIEDLAFANLWNQPLSYDQNKEIN